MPTLLSVEHLVRHNTNAMDSLSAGKMQELCCESDTSVPWLNYSVSEKHGSCRGLAVEYIFSLNEEADTVFLALLVWFSKLLLCCFVGCFSVFLTIVGP